MDVFKGNNEIYCFTTITSDEMSATDLLENGEFVSHPTRVDAVAAATKRYFDDESYRLGVYRVWVQRMAEIG